MDKAKGQRIIYTLAFLTAIGPFSIDAYLSGFPSIARDMGSDIKHVALSLTSYFIGISIGQLFYGPMLDRYGRKKPLIAGLLIYLLSSVGCALSPSIYSFISLRFLQAMGGCVGMVASRAIVRDLFSPHETAKVFSMMMLIMGVAPILAPIIGGTIVVTIGWRYVFAFLVLLSAAITFVIIKQLPESKEPDPSISFHPFKIVGGYFSLFKNRTFLIYTLASASASAALFTYISDSSFVFIQLFGISQSAFGWIYAFNALALVSASQTNRLMLGKKNSRQITTVTILLQAASALLLIISVQFHAYFIISMLFIFIYLYWLGFLNPNTNALALEPFQKNAGTASAMLGSIQMIFSALASALVSVFHNGTAMPMAVIMFSFAIFGMSMILWDKAARKKVVLQS
jgi:DHA1 family bicyclomycin/chloramphenicol resistance-like MFS transporter